MAISLEKILPISLEDYLEFDDRIPLSNRIPPYATAYDLVAVHLEGKSEPIENFARRVPDGAEVVVNYQHQFYGTSISRVDEWSQNVSEWYHHHSGIALIRKKEEQPNI